jgi:GNAT superfamily N-acetyltransferase
MLSDIGTAASMGQVHLLADGTRVLVRPLLPGDRAELAARYEELSPASRRRRFFGTPNRLSEHVLDYLTNLDYRTHFAWAAFAIDEPGTPGIAVARYICDRRDATVAELAVTVLDRYQHRGLGTLLTQLLADVAASNGVRTFVSYVLWENADAVARLRAEGARIAPAEPGMARIEIDLPPPPETVSDTTAHNLLSAVADGVRHLLTRLHEQLVSGRGTATR